MNEREILCPMCGVRMTVRLRLSPLAYHAVCQRCGRYRMDEGFYQQLMNAPELVRAWAMRERSGILQAIHAYDDIDGTYLLSWRAIGRHLPHWH